MAGCCCPAWCQAGQLQELGRVKEQEWEGLEILMLPRSQWMHFSKL